jgi:hypothetical protein
VVFLSPQPIFQGFSIGDCYVLPRTIQGPCVGTLSHTLGEYPHHYPTWLTQTAGGAAGADLVATTNVSTGEPVIWDLGSIAMNGDVGAGALFRDVLLASASAEWT